jgi:inorganic triphosphatase YgiF
MRASCSGEPPATETELKLRVPPGALRRLGAHPLLRGRAPAVVKKLRTVYFDTPEFDLRRQGVALRVRRDGRRWVQAVKDGGTVRGGLHSRLEIEAEVSGPVPDCARIADDRLAGIFASPELRAALGPVFVTHFGRRTRLIEFQDAVVEASIDRGEIRGGDGIDPVAELELELKSGPSWRLFELALELVEDVPLQVEYRSKAQRGYALAQGERPQPIKANRAVLNADMTVSAAFETIVWETLHHLQSNERGVLEGSDPEYLHQLRVALRRLRSAFSLFSAVLPRQATAPLVAELRWLAGALGPARDWDVFIAETLPPIREQFADHEALTEFARECARLRRAAARKAQRAVGSRRYQCLMLRLAGWAATAAWLVDADAAVREALMKPITEFAAEVLAVRYAQVRKRGRRLKRRSLVELHRLRIAVKKLRYAADFFSTLFESRRVRGMLSQLARLQTILGAMNDASTVENLVRAGPGTRADQALSGARGIVVGWSRGRALTLRRELRAAWKAFCAVEKFW